MGLARFPVIPDDERHHRLAPPRGKVPVVIDTDTHNEIDDQFALAWALLAPEALQVEAVYACPYSFDVHREGLRQAYALLEQDAGGETEAVSALDRYGTWARALKAAGRRPEDLGFDGPAAGMERSYEEILRVFAQLGLDPEGRVYRGSERYLASLAEPVPSPAAEDLVRRALAPRAGPLYVVAIGCLSNVASALLAAPEIIRRIVVVWTAGFPSGSHRPNYSFNLEQDLLASQLLFECGVPLVYLPGFHVGAQLRLSLPEMEAWVRGQGRIGDYLYGLYTHNPLHAQRGVDEHFARTWILWDLINIAWLINPDWVPSDLVPTPRLGDDKRWQRDRPGRPLMREAYEINRDAIFRDFFTRLEQAAQA